ncbi:CHAP domain-containing protein [Nonomuraea guangzhouensis]|uniref:CHAP domain-containing protein n=1 Tax=Nonomuraea guangzhouensis TaxID=1291555 RepID=A0ABW4GZU2_9ACTN|nr:CHAP domain-containing protein [Nonomuraea guangzhouensis]
MKKFIDLLESQLGYSEKGDAYTKFGHWYGKNVEFDADYSSAPWCDMYLSWAAHKLGYEDWIGQFAWTVQHAEWFKEHGAWGHKPQPGAFVFYDWGGSNDIDAIDHVGLVTKVEGDTIFTIEGNIDGGVAKRKERDTSKVVGYGYPEKVKTRLENEAAKKQVEGEQDAQQRANEQASTSTTDVGKLQLPDDTSLVDMITRIGQGGVGQGEHLQAPLATRPKQAVSPAPTATRKSSPAATTKAAEQAPKKGKHAKPATADTNAVTSDPAPLPTIVDASSATPVPTLSSPALIGSALVAAIAVLAVAKTRNMRVRPARAAALAAPAPAAVGHRRRRRKPRTETAPALARTTTPALTTPALTTAALTTASDLAVTTPAELITTSDLAFTAPAELITASDLAFSAPAELAAPAKLTASNELIASTDFDFAVPAEVVASALGSEPRLDVTDPRLVTGASRSILERLKPLEPIADLLARASAPIPEATTEFDAFSPVPVAATTRFDAFTPSAGRDSTPSTRRDSAPHRPKPRAASQHPGSQTTPQYFGSRTASQHPGSRTTHPQPGSRAASQHPGSYTTPQHPGSYTASQHPDSHTTPQHPDSHTPYTRATEPWPTAEQAESPQTGGYYGRRRRSGHPVEEAAPFGSDNPLRGRRHRPLGAAHGAEAFAQDAPSRGRRHRLPSAVPPRTDAFDTRARRQHSQEAPAASPTVMDELRAWSDELRAANGEQRVADGDLLVTPRTQAVAPAHPQPRTTHRGSRGGRHRA